VVDFYDFNILAAEWLNYDTWDPNILPKPKFEYDADSERLSVSRNSTALTADFSEVAANKARLEIICVTARPAITVYSDMKRKLLAVTHDKVIFTVSYSGSYSKKLLYTNNPEDPTSSITEIVDITTHCDFGGLPSNSLIESMVVLNDGSWLLSLSSGVIGSKGYLYRSEDQGRTWSKVLDFPHGSTPYFGWCGVADNELLAAEYGPWYQSDNPRDVYYSNDYGKTWHLIYRPDAQYGQHCHLAVFKPGDTSIVYLVYGDMEYCRWIKLKCSGDKTDINNWSQTSNSPLFEGTNAWYSSSPGYMTIRFNPVYALSDGRYIYWGKDSGKNPVILRHNPDDDSLADVFNWPCYVDDLARPYKTDGSPAMVFGMCIHNGVYYAAVRAPETPYFGAILVSVDGEHWAVAYRQENPDSWGFTNILGYMGGYLWGKYAGTDTSTEYLYRMTPVSAKNVAALRLEKGINNLINTADDSIFTGGNLKWSLKPTIKDVNVSACGISAEENLFGGNSYKFVLKDNNAGNGKAGLASPLVRPSTGKYVVGSFWIKGAKTWPDNFYLQASFSKAGNGGLFNGVTSYYRVLPYWQRILVWGKCLDGNFDAGLGIRLEMYMNYFNDGSQWEYKGNWSDATCYIDCVQVVEFDDLHYYGSFHPGGNPRPDEFASLPLTGVGNAWTISFEWKPENSSREWHGDVYIASILGSDGSYINLIYDQANGTFKLDNGTNSAFTVNTYTWEHMDYIRFAISSDGADSSLNLESPLSPGEALAAPSVSITGLSVLLLLNTDSERIHHGCGLFHSVRVWDLVLSAEQVSKVFDLP